MAHRPNTPGTKRLSGNVYKKPCGCTYAVVGRYTYSPLGAQCAQHKAEKSARDAINNSSPKSLSDRLIAILLTLVFGVPAAAAVFFVFYILASLLWLPLKAMFA